MKAAVERNGYSLTVDGMLRAHCGETDGPEHTPNCHGRLENPTAVYESLRMDGLHHGHMDGMRYMFEREGESIHGLSVAIMRKSSNESFWQYENSRSEQNARLEETEVGQVRNPTRSRSILPPM